MPSKVLPEARRHLLDVAVGPAIVYLTSRAVLASGSEIPCERLILPLGDEPTRATEILGLTIYNWSGSHLHDRLREEASTSLTIPLEEID